MLGDMQIDPRTASQIIDDLGGTKAVADEIGCGLPVVSNWRKAKIPPERWAQLVTAFPDDITFQDLAAQIKSRKRA